MVTYKKGLLTWAPPAFLEGGEGAGSAGADTGIFKGGGTVNKSYKKVGVDPKRGWVREGDMPPPARSAEAFDTL